MNVEDSPQEAEYRARCRDFLDTVAEKRRPGHVRGYRRGEDQPGVVARAREFQKKKWDAGFAGITWPKEWYGQGGTPIQQMIYDQEEANYDTTVNAIGLQLGICIPTICRWGTQAQRDRFAPAALRGEEVWCQFYSEPAGGSDLGALRTRAERDGDDWIINGQKIWTSLAHEADWAVLVARSDFDRPKHAGVTFLYLSTRTPGVDIQPIKQMSGASHFNQVFFNDVRIPDSQRLGPIDGGWQVAMSLLMGERYSLSDDFGPSFKELYRLAAQTQLEDGLALDDKAVQERLADFYVKSQGLRFIKYRIMTALGRGDAPGPEASIGKLVSATKIQEVAAYGLDLLGAAGLQSGAGMPLQGIFEEAFLDSPALRIAGGTDEILRNTIGERVLGLPQDVRVDKGIPFRSIPTGSRST
ncbi:MAG: acyl-CoA dehydrogenase [Chromatiales bacterium]|jgi:alkylation response protein AidB-like acyl-CoA dehydrogenase|nr:acyl-CoA dehydrogenase [Chromatiales bacterium]